MLENKTIIITGASSGIGRGAAIALLEQGANIVINARGQERLQELVCEQHHHASRIRVVPGDVGDPATCTTMAQVANQRFGGIDVLINNAGVFTPKPFLEATEDELDMYYHSAIKGSFLASQAVIPTMMERGGGSIINIGSMWVEHPLAATPCAASQVAKGGMHTLTRHLAIEFAPHNIRVNTIAPAVIDTPLYDPLMDRQSLQSLKALHPLGTLGNVADITSWILHLATDGGRFVTGQTLMVDGGITAGNHIAA